MYRSGELYAFFIRNWFIKNFTKIGHVTQETNLANLIFINILKKKFVCTLEASHCFLFLSRQSICFYTLIMKKNIKFHHSSFVNERKKFSFVLYSILEFNKNTKPLRNFTSKFRANS